MINDKLNKDEGKNLPKYRRDKTIIAARKSVDMLRKQLKTAEKRLKKRENELGLNMGGIYIDGKYEHQYYLVTSDRVPQQVEELLQSASNLFALGKRDQAEKIWDKLIKKYNLNGSEK